MSDSIPQATTTMAPAPQLPALAERRLRLWPGVILVILQWLLILVGKWAEPASTLQMMGMFFGPIIGAAAVAGWWLFASRLCWLDRGLVLLACAAVGAAAYPLYHSSIRAFGVFGVAIYVLPVVTTAWVCWLLITPLLSWPVRRAGLLVVFVLTWGYFAIVRFEGTDGSFAADFQYRWNPTAEERFLAEVGGESRPSQPTSPSSAAQPVALQLGDWPGFRGPDRDGRRPGVRIATDWRQQPPRLLWRHRVGPGWSSFAVVGVRLYTQEQRGADEVVVCYDADTGAELWVHRDAVRFSEVIGGPGPRATPTFHEGRIYAQGATGRLNCLDAATGRVLWARDIVADSGAKVPEWGFAASPLVVEGIVTVYAGAEGKCVLGYQASTGDPAWSAGEGKISYCSLHRAKLAGVEQLLIATENGLAAFAPTSGKVLWQHDWLLEGGMARVVQPTVLDGSDVLLGTGFGMGLRRVRVGREGEGWTTQEVWTSRAIKPYYNDLVIHRDHLYGFDGSFFTCVSLADGAGKWRARGYGNGQVLLLPDQDLLLVLSEKGEAALVEASPDGHRERGRFQAIEGKTWNHPVVAHSKLFVRNGEEAACYQLVEIGGENHARR